MKDKFKLLKEKILDIIKNKKKVWIPTVSCIAVLAIALAAVGSTVFGTSPNNTNEKTAYVEKNEKSDNDNTANTSSKRKEDKASKTTSSSSDTKKVDETKTNVKSESKAKDDAKKTETDNKKKTDSDNKTTSDNKKNNGTANNTANNSSSSTNKQNKPSGNANTSNTSKPSNGSSSSGSNKKPSGGDNASSGNTSKPNNGSSSSGNTNKPSTGGSSSNTSKPSGGNGTTTTPTTPTPHKHNYSANTVTKAATCSQAGVKTLTCSCGATKTEKIPATGNHDWRGQYEQVKHPAITHTEDQGHYEDVIIEEAWDEDIYDEHYVCKTCGADFGKDDNAAGNHLFDSPYDCQNYTLTSVKVDTIHHDAITKPKWIPNIVTITDKKEWTEDVLTGYKCSSCGATKNA